MAKKIIWSFKARDRYKDVIDYLLVEWGDSQALKFSKIVDHKLYLLVRFPGLGITSNKMPRLRSLPLTKHNRLIYSIQKNEIHILDIYDTRQEARK